MIGISPLRRAWRRMSRVGPHALGARRADVVLAQHAQHRGARHAHHIGHHDDAEVERRQRQIAQPLAGLRRRSALSTGNQPSWIAKTISSRMPETKAGNDRPTSETMPRGVVDPAVAADRGGDAERQAEARRRSRSRPASARSCRAGRAAPPAAPERPLLSDWPRLPVSTSPRKLEILDMERLVEAELCCAAPAARPRVAWSPRMTDAASPGTRRTSTKIAVSITNSVGIASSSRLTAYRIMPPPFAPSAARPRRRRSGARSGRVTRRSADDRADDRHELEAVAREAEGMKHAGRVRRRADDRQQVRGLRLHPGPGCA